MAGGVEGVGGPGVVEYEKDPLFQKKKKIGRRVDNMEGRGKRNGKM